MKEDSWIVILLAGAMSVAALIVAGFAYHRDTTPKLLTQPPTDQALTQVYALLQAEGIPLEAAKAKVVGVTYPKPNIAAIKVKLTVAGQSVAAKVYFKKTVWQYGGIEAG